MLKRINIECYLAEVGLLPVVDVRSPAEYAKGHIPNAVNIPIFSDEERAMVGTAYKQVSRERAIEIGMEFVQPKLQRFIDDTLRIAPNKAVVVHCWRGGMRSQSFAQHLLDNGFEQVYVIEKGYKAYRTQVLNGFNNDAQLVVIGGFTGSAKTDLLKHIKNSGDQQVIDLECLANHRGSAFGGIDQGPQPTTEQFENNLFWEWKDLDLDQPIWIEDESRAIGSVVIPQGLFENMRTCRLYFLDIPLQERAKHLVKDYGGADKAALEDSIIRISSRLGGLTTRRALDYLEQGDMYEVAKIMLVYYDKYYSKGVANRDPERVTTIPLKTANPMQNAAEVKKWLNGF
jgi:tRNA 2-selenouridine synthase